MNNTELDPSAEVVHLRRLLDIQPGCLLRLAEDGTVLAANDAALMLLGERSRAQALGRDFALWIPPEHQDRWKAFARGVVNGSRSSLECDIQVPSGARYPILFHATPLADHPDGVASMAVAARVISTQRQLEAAAHELKRQLQMRAAELQAGRDALAAAEAARDAAEAKCARALADVQQLEIALEQFARRQQPQAAPPSTAERDLLKGRLEESEQRVRKVVAERDALQRRLDEAVATATVERNRLAIALREQATHLETLASGVPSTAAAGAAEASAPAGGSEERR